MPFYRDASRRCLFQTNASGRIHFREMPQGGTILERYLRVGAILKRRLGEVPCRCPCLVTGGLRAEDNTNHNC